MKYYAYIREHKMLGPFSNTMQLVSALYKRKISFQVVVFQLEPDRLSLHAYAGVQIIDGLERWFRFEGMVLHGSQVP